MFDFPQQNKSEINWNSQASNTIKTYIFFKSIKIQIEQKFCDNSIFFAATLLSSVLAGVWLSHCLTPRTPTLTQFIRHWKSTLPLFTSGQVSGR